MNTQVKKKWLNALRSGEYEQGRGALQDDDGNFCCLGVLCDLYQKEHEHASWDEKMYNTAFVIDDMDNAPPVRERKQLPSQVRKWAGLSKPDGAYVELEEDIYGKTDFLLTSLNDGLDGASRHSFEEIATLIEDQL